MKTRDRQLRWDHLWTMLGAAGLTLTGFLVLCRVCRITPFGDQTFLFYDMKRQYVDFYRYWRRALSGQESLIYSLKKGPGGEMLGFSMYYLTSPFLLLTLLWPETALPTAITWMLGAKLALASAVMAWFLRAGRRIPTRFVLVLAQAYVWSDWFFADLTNTMWTDAVILLPLLLLWSERLTRLSPEEDENAPHPLPDIIRLALGTAALLFFNYYIAWMVLLFLALRCLLILITGESDLRHLLRTLCAVLTGALIVSPLLVPTVRALRDSYKLNTAQSALYALPAPRLIEVLNKLLPFRFDLTQLMEGAPALYCGSLTVLLAIAFFGCWAVPRRVRLRQAILFLILFVSFLVPFLSIVWQGGSAPLGYPYRYAFLWSFLMVESAGTAWKELALGRRDAWETRQERRSERAMAEGTEPPAPRRYLWPLVSVLLSLVLLAELAANTWRIYRLESGQQCTLLAYRGYVERMKALLGALDETELYRIESLHPREQNDALGAGYYGITHYGSEGNAATRLSLHRLGYPENGLYVAFDPENTETAAALLGIRALIDPSTALGDAIQQTPVALPMAWASAAPRVVLQAGFQSALAASPDDPFAYQSALLSAAERSPVTEELPSPFHEVVLLRDISELVPETTGGYTHPVRRRSLTFRVVQGGTVYFYLSELNGVPYDLSLSLDGADLGGYGNLSRNGVLRLGEFDEGEVHELIIRSDADFPGTPLLYTEDSSSLAEAAARIRENAGTLLRSTAVKTTLLSGGDAALTVTIPAVMSDGAPARTVIVNLPYETAWSASLNGEALSTFSLGSLYTGIVLPLADASDADPVSQAADVISDEADAPQTHVIELRYEVWRVR